MQRAKAVGVKMITELKIGDYIEKSELETEQKYNDVVEVFGQWGAFFNGSAVSEYCHLEDGHLVTIDIEYINSHMQSLKGWDNAINKTLSTNDLSHLRRKQRAQAGQTIVVLADYFEIGIA